jgi:hypothetical protein
MRGASILPMAVRGARRTQRETPCPSYKTPPLVTTRRAPAVRTRATPSPARPARRQAAQTMTCDLTIIIKTGNSGRSDGRQSAPTRRKQRQSHRHRRTTRPLRGQGWRARDSVPPLHNSTISPKRASRSCRPADTSPRQTSALPSTRPRYGGLHTDPHLLPAAVP